MICTICLSDGHRASKCAHRNMESPYIGVLPDVSERRAPKIPNNRPLFEPVLPNTERDHLDVRKGARQ